MTPTNQAHTPAAVIHGIATAWDILDRHATRARELCGTLAEAWRNAEEAVGFLEVAEVLALLERAADDLAAELQERYQRLPAIQRRRVGERWNKVNANEVTNERE
jgi:hypothetical protein